jgi:3(or 17)beta-hydroxysteroid dehydrogenase
MNPVQGKAAIPGAASGLGKAIALLLASEGAKVMATDLSEADGTAVVEEIKMQSGEAVFAKQDVTSESQWKEIVKATVDRFGKLDILGNCAGVFLGGSIEKTTLEQWRWVESASTRAGPSPRGCMLRRSCRNRARPITARASGLLRRSR